jgi:Ca2+-binding RTX toxin-like protein
MPFTVDVTFVGRQVAPTGTAVSLVWLFTTGPDFATRISVSSWGDGDSGMVLPDSPTTAFTTTRIYSNPFGDAFQPLVSVASFAAQVIGPGGFSPNVNVQLVIDPDADHDRFLFTPSDFQTLMIAGSGADTLAASILDDTLYGGAGNDVVLATNGDDVAYGEGGNDSLAGGRGNDMLWGNAGADSLDGGVGNDFIEAGSGADTVFGGAGADFMRGEDGNDLLLGGAGSDGIFAGNGADMLRGGDGNDDMDGGADNDLLSGDAGDDNLYGGFGDDTLVGSEGADDYIGGIGRDRLITSGDGARDVFRYDTLAEGGDTIFGFVRGQDEIQVEFADPGPLMVGRNPVATLPIGTFLFDTRTSEFLYDADGTGAGGPVLIAKLVGIHAFDGGDLFFTA